ncbi:PREDICTED: uncharacterized protein LOC108636724 isoform X2 [Capra hircus]|uniref:uncharacterized protein LOC108636724 isoform X2 n=1 Tax=Capra hircus TaxID=9925 RepID=UPI0008475B82|nr:PREDICTED: uncharacterized protein LOC108636724 isoform X2 [Capra hircus]
MQPSRHEELLAEKRKPPQTQDDCALKADHMGCCKLCPRPGSHSELVSQGQGGRRTAPTRLSCNRSKKQACLRKPSTHERKEREMTRLSTSRGETFLKSKLFWSKALMHKTRRDLTHRVTAVWASSSLTWTLYHRLPGLPPSCTPASLAVLNPPHMEQPRRLQTARSRHPPARPTVLKWSRITLQGDGQWLRCCVPNAGGPGSIPGQGTRFHMLHKDLSHMKILHATATTTAVDPATQVKTGRPS